MTGRPEKPLFPLLRAALLAVVATAAVAACRSASRPDTESPGLVGRTAERIVGRPGGSLRYRISAPPRTLNYLLAADEPSLIVAFYLIGGRLVEFDHDTQSYVPGLAERWAPAGDDRTFEVTLRDGACFSDGAPVSAADVEFTFRALYDERTASPAFRDAMLIDGQPIEVAALDARRLRLVFPRPVATPEGYFSNLAVLPRAHLQEAFDSGRFRESYGIDADPATIVTAGPFAVKSAAPGERVQLRRNPHYWKKDPAGNALPYLEELSVEVVADANLALVLLRGGEIDLYDRLRPGDYAALRNEQGAVRAEDLGPGLYTDHMWFNLNTANGAANAVANGKAAYRRAIFADVRFRRAVSLAIDRDSLANITLRGLATPLGSFVSPGNRFWVAADLPPIRRNQEQAEAMLREMGCVWQGEEPSRQLLCNGARVEFTLLVPVESPPRVEMAAAIQSDLARLGILMHIAPLEFGQLSRRLNDTFDYDAALFGISATEPDPSSYANFLLSGSPSHPWAPRQPRPATAWEARIDDLVAQVAGERNSERRRAAFREIQHILAEQLPVIPLAARHLTAAAQRRTGNYRPSALPPYSLWNAEELFIRP